MEHCHILLPFQIVKKCRTSYLDLSEYLDKPSENSTDKARKIHNDHIHDFVFDDGRIQNIALLDKKNIARNSLQVVKQVEQKGTHANRYDVTILVNGLPLVQVELKKRGVAIREALMLITHSLSTCKYLSLQMGQIRVISLIPQSEISIVLISR